MKKSEIIKKSDYFTYVINNGKNIKDKYISIYYVKSMNNLFGISIPKKYGNAVLRNKIKRQAKNIIDKNKFNIKKEYDYVIILKSPLKKLKFNEIEKKLMEKFLKIKD